VAAAHGVPIIDADAVLRPHTPHGILDQTVFLDDVHPTLRGQFLLGTALAEQLAAPYGEFIGRPVMLRPGTVRDAVVDFGLTAADLALAYERLAAGLDSRAILRFDTHQRQQDVERMRAIAKGLRLGELPMEGVEVEELE
jgi:phospholipase/lecithinase/hemolysin